MPQQRAAAPTSDLWSRHYAEGLRAHSILLQHCTDCGRVRFPAGPSCPGCWSERFEWKPHTGRGTVLSFVWYMKPQHPRFTEVPYNVAMVRLDDGPVLVSNIVGLGIDDLKVGRRVTATFADEDGFSVLLFQ